MGKPTLRDVEKYFKDAKVIESDRLRVDVTKEKMHLKKGIHTFLGIYWIDYTDSQGVIRGLKLWSEGKGYSKILEMKSKKVKGYILDKPEYKDAVIDITGIRLSYNSPTTVTEHGLHGNPTTAYRKLKEAGVLDLWFTPVYEQEEQKEGIKVGDVIVVEKERTGNAYAGNNGSFKKGHTGVVTSIQPSETHKANWLTLNGGSSIIETLVRKATKEEEQGYNIPEVGDIVVLISNVNNYNDKWSNNSEVPVGVPLKVVKNKESVHGTMNRWIRFEGYKPVGVSSNQVRKATPAEIEAYKNPILFKTEEGTEIREGDTYWLVNPNTKAMWEQTAREKTQLGKDVKAFTKQSNAIKFYRTIVKLPTLLGYAGKETEKDFIWGCYHISKEDVYDLIRLKIKSFVLTASGQEVKVSEDSFNQIKDYINKSEQN